MSTSLETHSARMTPAIGSQVSVKPHAQTRLSCQHQRVPNQLPDSTFHWFSDISFLVCLRAETRLAQILIHCAVTATQRFAHSWLQRTAPVARRRSTGCVTQYWNDAQLNSMTLRSEPRHAPSQLNSKSVRGDDLARWPCSIPPGGVAQGRLLIPVISSEFGVNGGGVEQNDGNGSGMSKNGL